MKKIRELRLMARDFLRVTAGKDYFHQPQELGGHFIDSRAYYNDFRGKANWQGPYENGVPQLYVPVLDRHVTFPIMVLQYGLGCVDRGLLEGDKSCEPGIKAVTQWLVDTVSSEGCLDNYFPAMDPTTSFYSSNSGMAQGEALSFLVRVVQHGLVSGELLDQAQLLLPRIFENMILPVQSGGTVLSDDSGLYFLELCRKDTPVILNGWIYALFGVLDYAKYSKEERVHALLKRSVETLEKDLEQFITSSGWSYYNNQGRVASPFYHAVHIVLLEALVQLFPSETLRLGQQRLCAGGHLVNRIAFTLLKVKEKLSDTSSYTTSKAA